MLIFQGGRKTGEPGGKPENPEENRRTRRKTHVARERINKQLNSHEVPEPRVEPTTHWDHSGERRLTDD
jgi:uncharacterized protein (DUF58 family)